MNFRDLVRPGVLSQPVYEPGKPIDYVARELGLDPATIVKLASNENPLGPSPAAVAAATAALRHGALYPDGGCFALREKLAAVRGLAPDQFVIGNGSNELIELLGHVFLGPGDEVVMATPAFVVYKLVALLFGATPVEVPLREFRHDLPAIAAAITPRTKLVFVCSPNNPTGTANTEAELLAFARALGEFGATIMLAGNIPGRTQTVSVAIYTAVQAGNWELAYRWMAIIVGISFVTIILMNWFSNRSVRASRGAVKRWR